MKNAEEVKKILNQLIDDDKKHIKFFDQKFIEYRNAKSKGANLYFVINGKHYLVLKHHEVKMDFEKSHQNTKDETIEKPSFATYFYRLLNKLLDYEDNDCTEWILDSYEYLKERVKTIYDEGKTCHIYQFKFCDTANIKKSSNNRFLTL